MVTISDVAARAGVGAGTVSRVLNGSPKVSPGTRSRVLEAMAALDFRPNPLAQRLSRGPLPDPRRRRPVLHPRLGGRAAPGGRGGPRREPLRPGAVQRRGPGAPRGALRLDHQGGSGRRHPRPVAPAAGGRPRPPRRPRGCPSSSSTCTATTSRRCSPTTSRAAGSPPSTCSASGTGASRSSARTPPTTSGSAPPPSRERAYRACIAAAGLDADPALVAYCPHDKELAQELAAGLLAAARPPDRGLRLVRRPGPRRARRRPRPPGCGCPRTCRSWVTTTSRSRPTPASPRSANPSSRRGASAPRCCSRRSSRATSAWSVDHVLAGRARRAHRPPAARRMSLLALGAHPDHGLSDLRCKNSTPTGMAR